MKSRRFILPRLGRKGKIVRNLALTLAFLGAELKSGIQCVLDTVGFDGLLEETDLVITGEGRIDSQSVRGKVISGIAKRTKPRNIPLLALVGGLPRMPEQAMIWE